VNPAQRAGVAAWPPGAPPPGRREEREPSGGFPDLLDQLTARTADAEGQQSKAGDTRGDQAADASPRSWRPMDSAQQPEQIPSSGDVSQASTPCQAAVPTQVVATTQAVVPTDGPALTQGAVSTQPVAIAQAVAPTDGLAPTEAPAPTQAELGLAALTSGQGSNPTPAVTGSGAADAIGAAPAGEQIEATMPVEELPEQPAPTAGSPARADGSAPGQVQTAATISVADPSTGGASDSSNGAADSSAGPGASASGQAQNLPAQDALVDGAQSLPAAGAESRSTTDTTQSISSGSDSRLDGSSATEPAAPSARQAGLDPVAGDIADADPAVVSSVSETEVLAEPVASGQQTTSPHARGLTSDGQTTAAPAPPSTDQGQTGPRQDDSSGEENPQSAPATPGQIRDEAKPAAPAQAQGTTLASVAAQTVEDQTAAAQEQAANAQLSVNAEPALTAARRAGIRSPHHSAPLQRAVESTEAMLRLVARRGVTQASLTLRPAQLGGIEVRLRATADGVVASVAADAADAAKLLQQSAGELRRALEDSGVRLLRLDIAWSRDPRTGAGGGDRQGANASPDSGPADPTAPTLETTDLTDVVQLPNGVLVDVLA
jgi:flagellar hook-length control protein FliK